jgi:hypothetical protein
MTRGSILEYIRAVHGRHINRDFPFSYLKAQLPDIDDKIRFVIPIMLDKVAVELGPWSGYHVLAQHLFWALGGAEASHLCVFPLP